VPNTLINETRRLQFPLDTLVDALIALEVKQGHWPPKATAVGAAIEDLGGGNAVAVLSIHRPESDKVTDRRYSTPMIAAAMVNYCVTMRVPIPRNSSKSLQVLSDGVALVLENAVILQSRHAELSTLPAVSVAPPVRPIKDGTPAGAAPGSDTEPRELPPEPTPNPPDAA
jgi:hypothetical protein